MRWEEGRQSENIEDRRGEGFSAGFPMGGRGGLGLGTILLLSLAGYMFGIDPRLLIGGAEMFSGGGQQVEEPATPATSKIAPDDQVGRFASAILAQTEDTWRDVFRQSGKTYTEPKLVLFSNGVRTACGTASSAVGPFYCPNDRKVYLDLSFFRDMKTKLNAPGDFAAAYVVAHEVGHHIQNITGILPRAEQMKQQVSSSEANRISVRIELQADCLAGVWAHHADSKFKILEQGDLEEAINAASAIGDDRLQKQAQGYVVPDSFTHGSSRQRVQWFQTGLQSGSVNACDTFSAPNL